MNVGELIERLNNAKIRIKLNGGDYESDLIHYDEGKEKNGVDSS